MKLIACTAALLTAAVVSSAGAQPAAATPAGPAASAAKEPGAVVTPSGLVYRALKEGAGESPRASDNVTVHYRGTLPNGKEFDSSYARNSPATFPLGGVIRCWTEGVQRMKVGGKSKLTCPPEIAYGSQNVGNGLIPPNSTLTFEVELLKIN